MNILIIHYNTPHLTECLVKSINKYVGTGCTIYLFDSSDREPFTYKQDNLIVFDNTHGQIINFENELKKYPNKGGETSGKFISFKHCISVDKCFELINDSFILLDSDVLLKKDISDLFDENYMFCGEVESNIPRPRLLPFCCFINVKQCKSKNINYFYPKQMHGLQNGKVGNLYDTGAAFYEHVKNEKKKYIKLDDYIVHYRSASWVCDYSLKRKKDRTTTEQWLYQNRKYWVTEEEMRNKRVIYTCITGGYENVVDPAFIQSDFDYVCFTDNLNQKSNVWSFRPIPDELLNLSKVKQQRIIKISPHKYLSEYDESLWVDGAIDILSNLNPFISTYCNDVNKSVFIRRHPVRKCIYREAYICIKTKKDTQANIDPQTNRYKTEGFPANYGLVESNIIYRKHNEEYCKNLMNAWENEIRKGSHRDQLSFNYCLWKIGDSGFKYLDSNLISGKYFKWYPKHDRKVSSCFSGKNSDGNEEIKKNSPLSILYYDGYQYY